MPTNGTLAVHCHNTWGQRTMQLLQCSTLLTRGSGQCNSYVHCLTARGQWTLEFLQCTPLLSGGSGPCNSCNARAH